MTRQSKLDTGVTPDTGAHEWTCPHCFDTVPNRRRPNHLQDCPEIDHEPNFAK